jgi:hypothetical protein
LGTTGTEIAFVTIAATKTFMLLIACEMELVGLVPPLLEVL